MANLREPALLVEIHWMCNRIKKDDLELLKKILKMSILWPKQFKWYRNFRRKNDIMIFFGTIKTTRKKYFYYIQILKHFRINTELIIKILLLILWNRLFLLYYLFFNLYFLMLKFSSSRNSYGFIFLLYSANTLKPYCCINLSAPA